MIKKRTSITAPKTTAPKVAPRTGAKVTKPISGGNKGTVTTPGFKPTPKKKQMY